MDCDAAAVCINNAAHCSGRMGHCKNCATQLVKMAASIIMEEVVQLPVFICTDNPPIENMYVGISSSRKLYKRVDGCIYFTTLSSISLPKYSI